jgi:TonB family protein
MKRCPTCLEEFADKFGFCPVDGTALNGHVAEPVHVAQMADESVTMAAGAGGYAAAADAGFPDGEETVAAHAVGGADEEYHLTILDDVGLTRRLMTEVREVAHDNELNWKEFKRHPGAFTQRAVIGYSRAGWKFFSQRNVALAVLVAFVAVTSIIGFVFLVENLPRTQAARNPYEDLELVGMVPDTEIPKEEEKPDEGPAGTNKGKGGGSKPKQEKPGGGGGGGRQDPNPVSFGKPAPGLMTPQLITPSVRPPNPNPSLPVAATIKADPLLMPPDLRDIPFGDPKSTYTTPSDGPGKDSGQGTGEGSGQGPGQGRGYGPGRGENVGGGDTNYGGGGPGGGGGGRDVDYSRPFQPSQVNAKAVIISKPEPGFTEEARKNNVTGLVRLRAVLSSGGGVTNISVIKGLPDGLTEKAIAAARNIKFRPAQKDGRTVSQWVTIEYNFNIY